MDEIIWENTIDNNTWKATVIRTNPYRGLLYVTNVATGECILEEKVHIAYDAPFGPDVEDLSLWMGRVIEVIDAQ